VQTASLAIVGALLLLVPGFLLGLVVRIRPVVAAAVAVPITFGMVVVGTIVTSSAELPWNPWSALVTLVAFLAAGALYSAVLARRTPSRIHAADGAADGSADAADSVDAGADAGADGGGDRRGRRTVDRLLQLRPRTAPWPALGAAVVAIWGGARLSGVVDAIVARLDTRERETG